MTDPRDPRAPASPSPEPPTPRRGLIGPFTGRQLGAVLAVVVVAAIALVLITRPIATGPTAGVTALPVATPYLVGSPTVGLQPGQQAPELSWTGPDGAAVRLTDLYGKPVRLEDLRGKLVLLNFWATWCPPCQGETPILRQLDEAYRDKGLAIVGVAVQETTPDDVRAYAERYQLQYPIAFDASADIFDTYRVFALPTQVFIGPDGTIRQVVNGPLTSETAKGWIEQWLPTASPSAAQAASPAASPAAAAWCPGRSWPPYRLGGIPGITASSSDRATIQIDNHSGRTWYYRVSGWQLEQFETCRALGELEVQRGPIAAGATERVMLQGNWEQLDAPMTIAFWEQPCGEACQREPVAAMQVVRSPFEPPAS